jgi:hypothetical protein
MTGQECSHVWAWEGIGTPTWEPGPAIHNVFTLQTGFITGRNTQFNQLSRWLVSDNPAGEEARCGGPGLATHGLWLGGWLDILSNSLKMELEAACGREINTTLLAFSHHANSTHPQNLRHLWHCVV